MKDARAYAGVGLVAAVIVLSAVLRDRSGVLAGLLAQSTTGLLAATAAIALVAYGQSRDPALLLVGAGAAAAIGHPLAIGVIDTLLRPERSVGWYSVIGFADAVGRLALLGSMAFVIPWTDRRGKPPLAPARVAAILAGGIVALDLAVFFLRPARPSVAIVMTEQTSVLGWMTGAALLAGGAIVAVRALPRGGRWSWIAAAGLGSAASGAAITLAAIAEHDAQGVVITWEAIAPALTAASLLTFVLLGIRLETSRMRRVSDRAAEVMQGRAEIASSIAHDVRGPVGTIKGLATTTRKSYDRLGDAERVEFIGMIEEESGRLLRLVDQVAVALKVDAGSLDAHPRRQSIAPLLRQAVEATEAGAHRIETIADPAIEAEADTRWLVEAVRQGLDNACGFSPADTPVVLSLAATDDAVAITIADHGPGIPSEIRESLFEKFSRWRPAGYEDRQGSALGLFICRGIARAHGGDATLEAAPSGGTMLRIRLPREGHGT